MASLSGVSSPPLLSLIVQVRDHSHLLHRWLTWAREQKTTLPILVADGSEGDGAREIVASPEFKDLQIAYFYPGPDVNRQVFYRKTVAALEMCRTPYVALWADDDLPDFGWLEEFSRALEDPGVICVRGWVHNFTLISCTPDQLQPSIQILAQDPSLDSPDSGDRVQRHFYSYNLNFHDIFRTRDLLSIKRKLLESRIEDPFLGELFTSVLAVIGGKVIRHNRPFLYRASRKASNDQRYLREHDNWDRIFLDHWMPEYRKCLDLWHEASGGSLKKTTLHRLFRSYYAPSVVDCLRQDLDRAPPEAKSEAKAFGRPPRAPAWAKILLEVLRPFEKAAQHLRAYKARASAYALPSKPQTPMDTSHGKILDFLARYHGRMLQPELQKFV